MAIAAATSSPTMSLSHSHSHDDDSTTNDVNVNDTKPDEHEHDMVMPGFRFHPTEEELVEFYLRRKVEGKRFNVELITFLDLYRYDPWELPALAAIGEKEWYFYVPRDRKYRNGDRPNRVTTSGYWKATGADRMIRTEHFRSIGLKKTLVFYSGKAPKGIRTSWIMNEYRLPQHETERYQKGEISLCRVYKRAGVEDHPSLPRCLPTRPSLSRGSHSEKNKHNEMVQQNMGFVGQSKPMDQIVDKMNEAEGSSSAGSDVSTALGLSKYNAYRAAMGALSTTMGLPLVPMDQEEGLMMMQQSKQVHVATSLIPACGAFFPAGPSSASSNSAMMDDLNRLVSYQQQYNNVQSHPNQFSSLLMQQAPISLNSLPNPLPTTFSDRLWEWNPIPEASQDYTNISFK
ncbi:NAC domain-containing protein 35 [Gastrolobium bilobum]|uniref:NAC domain-containing protein 35 n=1 Tax=Gastrolobium bilobum TaxID=150636 RepID=UPI002AAF7FB8|nr:NAC domain-containing protein 35 [Gastrolobium bilobum]